MSDCPVHFQLAAYHDGELDGESAARVADHLANCDRCSGELAELKQVTSLFAAKAETPMLPPMLPLELARLHRHLDESTLKQPGESEFLRTAGMLSALAASILVISSVWLAEFPSRHAAALSPGVAVVPASDLADMPDWERTAFTLRVEPQDIGKSDESQIPQIGLADSRSFSDNSVDGQVADWMVAGLSAGGGHANP